ncbi:DUF1330 domain-containing protein [Ancylobacter lacus]|uniref:DUF1330 domain-containing protein n=1 Tax=Ancylobacter lacus TaxID=2579970 RepID=UPI001BCCCB87|nr:DUF1330 domain-containing protein [Ancylobacter lacus]
MARGYWVVRLDVTDMDTYMARYFAAAAPVIERFGGRFLVLGGAFEAPEPPARNRQVVVEFADYDTALACWNDPAFQAAFAERQKVAHGEHLVIEGYEGGQPAAGVIDRPATGPGTAYWILRIDVRDTEAYKAYVSADALAFQKYRGWYLVRGGRHAAVEGHARSRNVVVAFPDYATALACYRSPEYQNALAFRKIASEGEVVIARGAE